MKISHIIRGFQKKKLSVLRLLTILSIGAHERGEV